MERKGKKKNTLLKLRLYNLFIRCFDRMSLVPHLRYYVAASSGDWFSFAVLHSRTFWRFVPHLRYYLAGSSGGWWKIFRPRSSHYLLCFFLSPFSSSVVLYFSVIGLYLSICFCTYNFALFVICLLIFPFVSSTSFRSLLLYVLSYIIASVCRAVRLCLLSLSPCITHHLVSSIRMPVCPSNSFFPCYVYFRCGTE